MNDHYFGFWISDFGLQIFYSVFPSPSQVTRHPAPATRDRLPANSGFSLLEVIIATAVLAGGAMVLLSMIGTGSRFGSRAEQRTLALSVAQSVLDEHLAQTSEEESEQEVTGTTGGRWPMAYRISTRPFQFESRGSGASSGNASNPLDLNRITVEVFETEQQMTNGTAPPLCTVHRIARKPSKE